MNIRINIGYSAIGLESDDEKYVIVVLHSRAS